MAAVYSLRTRILITILAFIVSGFAGFFLYSIATTGTYKRMRLYGIEKTIDFETEKVNKIIAEMERGAIFYAQGGMLCYESQSEELGERIAIEYLESFPIAVGGGFWFEPYAFKKDVLRAGFYAFYDKVLQKVRIDDTFFMDEYDYHNMPWYREVADSVTRPNQVVWTRPYVDTSGSFSLMTTASSPIFNADGKLIAMSTVDWEIEEVVNQMTALEPTANSFVLLCAPDKDYIISCTLEKDAGSIAGKSLASISWDINANSFNLDGVKYMSFARYMDNGWLLSVQIPENEIFAEMENRNIRYLALITVMSILTLLAAYLLISSFMENVRERSEKERIGTELEVAARIQANMLPSDFPPFPERTEFSLHASMLPAREVGGDFYDFYFLDKNNLAVVIADVSGKGIPAALFMVIARTLIKNCSLCRGPKDVFESVNKKLCENNEAGMFVTAFMGVYNLKSGKFTYVNAGHNPPLLKRKGKPFEYLRNEPCLILAWRENVKYTETEIYLEKGDTLYLYTDGVTEAVNRSMDMFAEERLLEAAEKFGELPPKELLSAIKGEVDSFADGVEQADDITMLALKVNEEKEIPAHTLTLEAKVENLEKAFDFVNAVLEDSGCPPDLQNEIDVAVEEIFVNIANYAYDVPGGQVSLCVSAAEKIVIQFEDSGKAFNPLEKPDPDLEKPAAQREIGGVGIFLVKKIMDSVEYSRKNDKNILKITKNFQISR